VRIYRQERSRDGKTGNSAAPETRAECDSRLPTASSKTGFNIVVNLGEVL
jgi:hypothetical protein